MTIVYKREEFTTASGQRMYIEQYAEKPHFGKFWRYGECGYFGRTFADHLLHKPNKKRIIENF